MALGVVMACKNEGRTLELEEKEKWCVDEVKRLKAIVVTVVGTKTRLSAVEYKEWRSLRGRDYLSKERMKRQVRGSLVIVSEIRETLRLFTRLVTERDMLHEKDYIAKIPKAREDEDIMAFHRECREDSTNLHNFTSREVALEEREIPNCGDGLVPRRYGITGARQRQREVQQQTELPLLQYLDHFAGNKRPTKTKLRTNVK